MERDFNACLHFEAEEGAAHICAELNGARRASDLSAELGAGG